MLNTDFFILNNSASKNQYVVKCDDVRKYGLKCQNVFGRSDFYEECFSTLCFLICSYLILLLRLFF